MKKISFLFVTALLYLFAASCGNPTEQKHDTDSGKDLKSYRENLPAYTWLSHSENHNDAALKDSAYYYFNKNLDAKNFEDAAIYLFTYSHVLDKKMEFDSIHFDISRNLYNNHKDELSGETQTNLCYYLGTQSHLVNNLVESSEWLEKGIAVPSESKAHKQILGFSNFALAQNYSLLRDFEATEKHLVAALSIFMDVGDITNQGTVYLLLYNTYMQRSAYKEAEANLEKGLRIVKKQNSEALTFSAYSMYVNLNVAKADTIAAIQYIDSLAIHAEASPGIAMYHKAILNQLLAFKHIAKREEAEALEYLKISRDLTDGSNSPDLQMRTLFQELVYAEIFDKPLENVEEVKEFYEEIASHDEPNRQYMNQLGAALFKFYRKKGEHEKANAYASFLLEDKDKALEETMQGRLFELEHKFQAERKEKTILLQEKQLESQKGTIMALGAGAVFLALIFSLFLFWNKNRSILREKSLTDNFTSQLLSKTEDERKRIASDLHDSVSNELVSLRHELQSESFGLKAKIDSILEEVRNISRNLSPALFDKLGLKQSIEQLTERAQNQYSFFLTSDIEYSGALSDTAELQLYRVIQEAITNIVKHADAMAGKITITEDAKFVYAEIKDNGKGFDVDKMLEKGNCFGLLNIRERAKMMNGTAHFKSDTNGTILKISIPK